MHQWVYARIKERSVQALSQQFKRGQRPVMFVSGVRRSESIRRMGYAKEVVRGSGFHKDGNLRNPSRMFVAPCLYWEPGHQEMFRQEFGLEKNKIKELLGISGECFCGSMAGEDVENRNTKEWEIIQTHPLLADVKEEILRLQAIAKSLGLPCEWGKAPKVEYQPTEIELAELGMFTMDLCVGCRR